MIDTGLSLWFPAPHSFTGEDVLELHAHGGAMVLKMLLDRIRMLGARDARAGEFSERAFLNGKLDLAQAEAVADLISAGSVAAARAAQRSLQGEFSSRCRELADATLDLRMRVEAAIDFAEEDIDFLADDQLRSNLSALRQNLNQLLTQAEQGRRLNDGLTVVLAGIPNVGKSSLLNRLAQTDAAIVTPIAGTTRDLLRESVVINGVPVELIDTAGLCESENEVEREGVRRARAALAQADHVLILGEEGQPAPQIEVPAGAQVTRLLTKCDLGDKAAGWVANAQPPILRISSVTGDGLEELRRHLSGPSLGGGNFSARQRHVAALRGAAHQLQQAAEQLQAGQGDLVAEELRLVQRQLGEITGQVSSEDLLGQIFSGFCIGK